MTSDVYEPSDRSAPPLFRFDAVGSPRKGFIVSGPGDPWPSVLADWREDIECGKNACHGEVQHSKR